MLFLCGIYFITELDYFFLNCLASYLFWIVYFWNINGCTRGHLDLDTECTCVRSALLLLGVLKMFLIHAPAFSLSHLLVLRNCAFTFSWIIPALLQPCLTGAHLSRVFPFNIRGIWIFVINGIPSYSWADSTDRSVWCWPLKKEDFLSCTGLLGLFMEINKQKFLAEIF